MNVADAPAEQPVSAGRVVSLRRRLVFGVAAASLAVLALATWGASATLWRSMGAQQDAELVDAARRSVLLVDRVLQERVRQVDLMTAESVVIDAARKGTELSRARGLVGKPIPVLEQQFKATRSQQVDPAALAYLTALLPRLDIAEVMVTDEYGYNAVTTSPSSDFVQSDEAWWQQAWKTGTTEASASDDPATGRTVVELARVITAGGAAGRPGAKVGVAKVKFGLAALDSALQQAGAGEAFRVDLIDATGHLIASSEAGARHDTIAGVSALPARSSEGAIVYDAAGVRQRGAVRSANRGRWRVVAHVDEETALADYRRARLALWLATGLLLLLILGGIALVGRFIERRITGPAAALATVAEAVAAGDLSRDIGQHGADDEIGRLTQAVSAMTAELRRLASAIAGAANETAAMTAEITAGTEEMAASAGEIAHTASDLSAQSSTMAQSIQALSSGSEQLVRLAAELDAGAREGVERNDQLRALATQSRQRLDESARALEALTTDVQAGATAVESLAAASTEVRSFVTLVQKLARQSKLLALNAAMEAARAGEHGQGFAVVATEVRRLAATSSDAAERTERIVADVLRGIEASRESSERVVATVREVRAATEHGARSFHDVERGVESTTQWTTSIEAAAASANDLVKEFTTRLGSLAAGTESFAAAMQEVAAASEEQSASSEQIAAAASALTQAADRLKRLVADLRVERADRTERAEPAERGAGVARADRLVAAD